MDDGRGSGEQVNEGRDWGKSKPGEREKSI